MSSLLRYTALVATLSFAQAACAAGDPLLAALDESRNSGKGLSFLVNGQSIPGVVVSVDERYVVARSQGQGTVVIRLDRLDGVAGFVSLPAAERK